MRSFLIVVDMQNDFVYGPLGNKDCKSIVPSVIAKVINFNGAIIFTKDTHRKNYLDTLEGRNLPVEHCIAYSEGWELIDELEEIRSKGGWPVYQKGTFGCVNLAVDLRAEHIKDPIESIEFIGVCTSICVISNALICKAYLPEVPISVDSSCCACVTPESHLAALEAMKMSQITIQ